MAIIHAMRPDQTDPKLGATGAMVSIIINRKGGDKSEVMAPYGELKQATRETRGVGVFALQIDGEDEPRYVIVQRLERPKDELIALRMNVLEVQGTDVIRTHLPVTPIGAPKAVTVRYAVLDQPTKHVKVRAQVGDLPNAIEVDVSKLPVGAQIHAGDVTLPKGVELLDPEESMLFHVRRTAMDARRKNPMRATTPASGT